MTTPSSARIAALDLREFALLALTIACANGVLTNMALLMYDGGSGGYALRDLVRLMALGLVDLIAYRPILIVAQAKGLVDFLRGEKSWNKFERNKRGTTNSQYEGFGERGEKRRADSQA